MQGASQESYGGHEGGPLSKAYFNASKRKQMGVVIFKTGYI